MFHSGPAKLEKKMIGLGKEKGSLYVLDIHSKLLQFPLPKTCLSSNDPAHSLKSSANVSS